MNSEMKSPVTVIIPTYNRQALIFQALASVVQQSRHPLEVLVVDDCSTDGTVDAVRSASFPFPVEVISMETNGGPAAARNAGILRAQGRYIAFLDSDDVWLPEKLERQLAVFETLPQRERTVLYSQVSLRRRHETLVRPVRAKKVGEPIADYVFANGGYLDQNTVMLPTALARDVLYKSDMRLHEDWDFYLRLEERGAEFVMVDGPLGITYDNSASGRASSAQPLRSLAFLEQWQSKISAHAYFGLRARIAPQLRGQRPFQAASFIFDGYRKGAISHWMALALVGSLIHPDLRQLAYYSRSLLTRLMMAAKR